MVFFLQRTGCEQEKIYFLALLLYTKEKHGDENACTVYMYTIHETFFFHKRDEKEKNAFLKESKKLFQLHTTLDLIFTYAQLLILFNLLAFQMEPETFAEGTIDFLLCKKTDKKTFRSFQRDHVLYVFCDTCNKC